MNPVALLREVVQARRKPVLVLCVFPRGGAQAKSWNLALAQLDLSDQEGVQLTLQEVWPFVYWNRDKALARAIAEAYPRGWLVYDGDLQFGCRFSDELAVKFLARHCCGGLCSAKIRRTRTLGRGWLAKLQSL